MKMNSAKRIVKTKSERLSWSSLSDSKPMLLVTAIGEGKKVTKGTYANPRLKYRTLVP